MKGGQKRGSQLIHISVSHGFAGSGIEGSNNGHLRPEMQKGREAHESSFATCWNSQVTFHADWNPQNSLLELLHDSLR